VREKLIYYPTVTREEFRTQGRLTDAMSSGKLFDEIGLPMPTLDDDRFMICGSPSMLKDTCAIIEAWGFKESRHGIQAHYVIERAFVE
jgi:ferredoxin--NADP+ reductase